MILLRADVAGIAATRTARSLGAIVNVFDSRADLADLVKSQGGG